MTRFLSSKDADHTRQFLTPRGGDKLGNSNGASSIGNSIHYSFDWRSAYRHLEQSTCPSYIYHAQTNERVTTHRKRAVAFSRIFTRGQEKGSIPRAYGHLVRQVIIRKFVGCAKGTEHWRERQHHRHERVKWGRV
jgi:hypothetical protein